jgi:hypothetical protein
MPMGLLAFDGSATAATGAASSGAGALPDFAASSFSISSM